MTKQITYGTKTAQWLIDHADELTYSEFSNSIAMLDLAQRVQNWGALNHRRFYTKAQVEELNTISAQKLGPMYGEAAESAGLDYDTGIKLLKNSKNALNGLSLEQLRAIDEPLQKAFNNIQETSTNIKTLGSSLKTLMDRVEVLANNATSNAWRIAYIVQTLLMNERLIKAGQQPSDVQLTLDGIEDSNIKNIGDTLPTIELGMNAAGAWNLELKMLAKKLKVPALNDMASQHIGQDASFPVLSDLSNQLYIMIKDKLKAKYVGKSSKNKALEKAADRYAPLMALTDLHDAPAINDGNVAEAQKMVDKIEITTASKAVDDIFDYLLTAMNNVDRKGGKSGEITEKD